MKFYVVTWRDESQPEGIGYEFFERMVDAKKVKAELDKADRQGEPCSEGCRPNKALKNGEECPECGFHQHIHQHGANLESIEFKGTAKQIAFKALKYQVV